MDWKIPETFYEVGFSSPNISVWLEDYVLSYLKELNQNQKKPMLLVFYGDGFEKNGIKYYFMKGLAAKNISETDYIEYEKIANVECGKRNKLKPEEEHYFLKIQKKHFANLKGIGWCAINRSEDVLTILRKIRGQNFICIQGYSVYYERNGVMQEYLISFDSKNNSKNNFKGNSQKYFKENSKTNSKKKKNNNFQSIKQIKGAEKLQRNVAQGQAMISILNILSLVILIICCIIAVTTLNQYDKMKQLEETVSCLEIYMEQQEDLPND